MCSLSARCISLVVAITAQRLHSKVRDFGIGKNLDFGVDNLDMGCSQRGQTGTIIAECSSIGILHRTKHPAAEACRGIGGGAKPAEGMLGIAWGLPVYSELYTLP
jgi:hypothetical protein